MQVALGAGWELLVSICGCFFCSGCFRCLLVSKPTSTYTQSNKHPRQLALIALLQVTQDVSSFGRKLPWVQDAFSVFCRIMKVWELTWYFIAGCFEWELPWVLVGAGGSCFATICNSVESPNVSNKWKNHKYQRQLTFNSTWGKLLPARWNHPNQQPK